MMVGLRRLLTLFVVVATVVIDVVVDAADNDDDDGEAGGLGWQNLGVSLESNYCPLSYDATLTITARRPRILQLPTTVARMNNTRHGCYTPRQDFYPMVHFAVSLVRVGLVQPSVFGSARPDLNTMMNAREDHEDATAHCCAECGISLKTCNSCKIVKYRNAACQLKQWLKHKKRCKLRAAELT